jgi:aminopeptidase
VGCEFAAAFWLSTPPLSISMHDPRIDTLADLLLDHSCRIQRGEKVLIEAFDLPEPNLVCRLVEGAAERGVVPLVSWKANAVLRSLYQNATEASMKLAGDLERARMEQMNAYIGIRGSANGSQFADVPQPKMDLYQQHWWQTVHTAIRVPKTKWVVLRYPTDSFAQAANMSTAAFEDFYFNVCTADYAAMREAQKPLACRMRAADRVRITAPATELEFSIKGIPVIECWGERNIPDGEVFTAPVRDSINGKIRFNAPSRYQGTVFENVEFEFRDGKIIRATANETEKINAVLDSDEGARYCGEWAVGVNNRVLHPMLDTLFDEKIGGSFHLTPGQAYEIADNGNRSRIHWDLVLIQRPDYGGGEMWFDGELIRKDGRFVPTDLQGLNAGL